MSYCMNPPTIGWTGAAQPVGGGGKVNGHARDYATCIRDYLEATGGRADKLLLGVANDLGGTEWTCQNDKPLSPIIGRPRKLTLEQARANAEKHGRRFNPEQKAPWYCYKEGDRWVQGWYEDEESVAAKFELAKATGLQGVCIWILDGAKEPPGTFELIHRYLLDR
jgi:spore germination protein YaaH